MLDIVAVVPPVIVFDEAFKVPALTVSEPVRVKVPPVLNVPPETVQVVKFAVWLFPARVPDMAVRLLDETIASCCVKVPPAQSIRRGFVKVIPPRVNVLEPRPR